MSNKDNLPPGIETFAPSGIPVSGAPIMKPKNGTPINEVPIMKPANGTPITIPANPKQQQPSAAILNGFVPPATPVQCENGAQYYSNRTSGDGSSTTVQIGGVGSLPKNHTCGRQ